MVAIFLVYKNGKFFLETKEGNSYGESDYTSMVQLLRKLDAKSQDTDLKGIRDPDTLLLTVKNHPAYKGRIKIGVDSSSFSKMFKESVVAKRYVKYFKESEGKIVVITYGGKKNFYTKNDIKDMLDNPNMYKDADNLPKWIYSQSINNKRAFGLSKINIKEVFNLIQNIYDYDGDILINVQSDKPQLNKIEWL